MKKTISYLLVGLVVFFVVRLCSADDPFVNYPLSLSSPASDVADVVTSDTTPMVTWSRALYIGVGGDVKLTTVNGETVTFKNVPIGILSVRTRQVWTTGTTATNIEELW